MHKKIQDSYLKKEGGNTRSLSLVSTIDDSAIPQDCVENYSYAEHKVTGKTYTKILLFFNWHVVMGQ